MLPGESATGKSGFGKRAFEALDWCVTLAWSVVALDSFPLPHRVCGRIDPGFDAGFLTIGSVPSSHRRCWIHRYVSAAAEYRFDGHLRAPVRHPDSIWSIRASVPR